MTKFERVDLPVCIAPMRGFGEVGIRGFAKENWLRSLDAARGLFHSSAAVAFDRSSDLLVASVCRFPDALTTKLEFVPIDLSALEDTHLNDSLIWSFTPL